jgi:hypothetical protein
MSDQVSLNTRWRMVSGLEMNDVQQHGYGRAIHVAHGRIRFDGGTGAEHSGSRA